MTFNINSALSQSGADGAAGVDGADGTSEERPGGMGGEGGEGGSAILGWSTQTFLGDGGADLFSITRTTVGGDGGSGGTGGRGANAEFATETIVDGANVTTNILYDIPGFAGAAGNAGAAGTAQSRFTHLIFDLRPGASGDTITLNGSARGGNGLGGGSGNSGGFSGIDFASFTTLSGPPISFAATNQTGSAGGLSTIGKAGASGADARTAFTDIAVQGGRIELSLTGSATGGNGGNGGRGGDGANGSEGTQGQDGGDGGNGGDGRAEVRGLTLSGAGETRVIIELSARGGDGGTGGRGGEAGNGTTTAITTTDDVTSGTTDIAYAATGSGGQGGHGGDGVARLIDSSITGSGQPDFVTIRLSAFGSNGGSGAIGGAEVPTSMTDLEGIVINVAGTAAGDTGMAGSAGDARAIIRNVSIDLGDGSDVLTLALQASGPGSNGVTVTGSTFAGGLGNDTLILGDGSPTRPAAVVDVDAGTLRLGRGGANVLTGFESITGGGADDRFIDGTGNQTYAGGGGADLFVFLPGRTGDDRINGFGSDDIVRLQGFGPTLNSFAEVLAATSDTAQGALLRMAPDKTVLIAGVVKASLASDDFLF
jgi:hypothetical protein